MSLLVLTREDVIQITAKFTPQALQALMEDVFALISSDSSEDHPKSYSPHRISIPAENHKVLFMPARISSVGTTVKVVSTPSNAEDARGIPGSTLMMDKNTGAVKAIVNARSLTALRNAAGSLLSTTLVGPKLPTHVVAFGAGQQILAHLDLHFRAFGSVRSCTIVNRTLNDRVSTIVSELQTKHPTVQLEILVSTEKEALRDTLSKASIVICATPSRVPLFPSSWVANWTHVILIGSYTPEMKEVDTDLVMRAVSISNQTHGRSSPILLVDSVSACFTEAGELLEAKLRADQVVEIGKLVLERQGDTTWDYPRWETSIRSDALDFQGPITMFKSVGVGLQDVAIACAVIEKAEEMERQMTEGSIGVVVPNFD
ncbi:hypothetical protein BDP27DRAFT_1213590 [Rhodocollybia butyracea]|uniref:Ornithine cyclodeaminase n=1 Tax=Rhodocollybia butyracea TaxID=206335 RepID=A0A9P5UDB8_9AGAR|nr:hypothetical protein BDP27DRAFT_1213590 [Rhodocollybia butyracea]